MNSSLRYPIHTGLIALLALGPCLLAHGQTRGTLVFISATNTDYWPTSNPPLYALEGGSSPQGAPLLAELAPRAFSGVDSNNAAQTMTYSGRAEASSAFGVLRISARGTVGNTFYNENNAPFYRPDKQILNPDGVPDRMIIDAQSEFLDILQWGGELESGYKARYIFRITGHTEGAARRPFVVFQIEGSSPEVWQSPAGQQGPINTIWATQSYPVLGFKPQTVSVRLGVQIAWNTQQLPEGIDVYGEADLGNTVVLEEVIVTDADDNVVTGWTLDSASGTDYTAIDGIYRDRFEAEPGPLLLTGPPGGSIQQVPAGTGRIERQP